MIKVWRAVIILFFIICFKPGYCYEESVVTIHEYPMRFAVIGDRTGEYEPGVYGEIVKQIQRMKPDFVLSVGDMIEGYLADTAAIKDGWEDYKELLKPLTMPIYLAPGNNDIWDSTSLELYKRYVGEPYYSFNIRGVHFVVLDNSRNEKVEEIPKEQIYWLINDLEENRDATHTIVFFHKPFWMKTVAQDKPDSLHMLFVKYGVDAVFTGHYHQYFAEEFNNIAYTGVGSSGGGCSPGPTGLKYHFVWVTVDGNGISISPIKMGAVLPWDEVTAKESNLIYRIESEAIKMDKALLDSDLMSPERSIRVTLSNIHQELSLTDTLRWEVPDGWSIDPVYIAVDVLPLNSKTININAECDGLPYPTPVLSINYPYAKGKKCKIREKLNVSRTTLAYKANEPPIIDGKLTENVWKNPVTKFFAEDGSPMPSEPVDFYFAWDENNLYLAAKCIETKMEEMVANVREHDGAIYGEDCIGYFLQPEISDGSVYQIYFNPLGTSFDQKISVDQGRATDVDREWNGTYEAKTSKGKDWWSIEVKIPFHELKAKVEPGKTWAINFRRKQKRLNASTNWLSPITYDPCDYGILVIK